MPVEPVIGHQELRSTLLDVFREHGYEGATLRLISERTGLQRSSLYHRFPGGKDEMAHAVMDHVDEWFEREVIGALKGAGPLDQRVRRMADALNAFYGGGRRSCVLDTLSLGAGGPLDTRVRSSFLAWREALKAVAHEAGRDAQQSATAADDAIVLIEGALVYARATQDTRPFTRALDRLPTLLTDP